MITNFNSRIYCYTGTGNCYAAAKQISNHFDSIPIEFITQELVDSKKIIDHDFSVLIMPSYAYGVPKLARRFLKTARFKVKYLAVAVLQGSSQRGTAAEAVKILSKQGQEVAYASGVNSVENYVPLFGHPKDAHIQVRNKAQQLDVEKLCEAYQNKDTKVISLTRPLSAFVSAIFRGASLMFPKFYRVLPSCNACRICQKVCPPNAITMVEKKGRSIPKFKAALCDHCQACLQLCPKKAIRFTRIKQSSPRYLHKDVTLSELIKRK